MSDPRAHPRQPPAGLRARLAVAALVTLLAIVSLSTAALPTLAAEDSNIPGVPLPGSVVTGRLGGAIYDRVYSIDVAPNRIILMSLTGDPGTDFDLYLFDSSATSVYGGAGQVAASTGSTSSESISYPARSGGRYYIDLSGFSEAEGNFRLVVAIATDTTPPHADLQLNGRKAATTDPTVVVTLVATDDLAGVDEMQYSPDGTTWLDWRPYTPTILWTFDAADGLKKLWARVRDRSGNISSPAIAGITVDTLAPTLVGREPDPGGTLSMADPTIRVQFNEPLDPDSWVRDGLVIQDTAGGRIPGELAWDPETNTGSFTLEGPTSGGATYTVTIGAVTDLAGNPLPPLGSWIVQVRRVHKVTIRAASSVVAHGATVRLSGTVDLPLTSSVVLERSLAGGAWNLLGPLAVDATGAFATDVQALGNATYRARVVGSASESEIASSAVRVLVRRGVVLAGQSATVTKTGAVGASRTVTALLTPASPNVAVTLTVARYDTARRAWRTVSTSTRTSVSGRATFTWRPTTAGSYYLRVATASQSLFANAVSPVYRWTIR